MIAQLRQARPPPNSATICLFGPCLRSFTAVAWLRAWKTSFVRELRNDCHTAEGRVHLSTTSSGIPQPIIKDLPRAPNDKTSRASLEAMPTRQLIQFFITWRMRLIPAKPQKVGLWAGSVTPSELHAAGPRLRPLLKKVETGKDLNTSSFRPRDDERYRAAEGEPLRSRKRHRHGTHSARPASFPCRRRWPRNPKGRSGLLVFAEVLEKEFRIVAISDHRAFDHGSPEQLRFFRICTAYVAKDIPPGQAFMANPVLTSGHSLIVTLYGNHCEDQIERLDPKLDNSTFIDRLYDDQPILRDGN